MSLDGCGRIRRAGLDAFAVRSVGMRGRNREHPSVLGLEHLPAAFKHIPVMAVAQEDEIRDVGVATVAPMEHVVPVNPQMYVDNQ